MTARAIVQRADHAVTVERLAGLEERSRRQVGGLVEQMVEPGLRQRVDADELNGQIVRAPGGKGARDNVGGRRVEIRADRRRNDLRREMVVHAVRAEHE